MSAAAPPGCWRQQFLPRVRELLRQVGVLHVDETPVRADGALEYVHAACTEFLTAMHTGGRSKDDIDAGQVLPGYTGTIVRDGYAGYVHLIDAHHAWCGAHLIRDLAAFHRVDPKGQFWAAAMADTLTDAHHHAQAARAAGHDHLAPDVLTDIRRRYHGATARRDQRQHHPRRAAGRAMRSPSRAGSATTKT